MARKLLKWFVGKVCGSMLGCSTHEPTIAILVVRCRSHGMKTSSALATGKRPRWRRWVRVFLAFVLVPLLLYVVGYFVVMDRHQPTSPFRQDAHYFESSYRWATKQNSQKGGPPDMPWPNATGWNDLYRPLDKVYFRYLPRSGAEIERLRHLGSSQ